jgi:hypothetical protein
MFEAEGLGIFSGEGGAKQHYQAKQLPLTGEGVTNEVTCDNCGLSQQITIAWQQIAEAAASPRTNRLPVDPDNRQSWVLTNGKMYPLIGCISCRQPICLAMTPDEAIKLLLAGQQAGLVRMK